MDIAPDAAAPRPSTPEATRPLAEFIERFADGWHHPHPHAWDDIVADNVVLEQPLLPARRGRGALAEEYGRLLRLVPDLTGEVTAWGVVGPQGGGDAREDGAEDTQVDLHLTLRGTLGGPGGPPLVLPLVDHCTVINGVLTVRRSYFDPLPLITLAARTPAAWVPWWRSGVGPLLARRELTRRLGTRARHPDAVDVLAFGRLLLGLPAWAAPRTSARIYGFDHRQVDVRYLTAVYGIRACALALGTLTADPAARRTWQRLGLLVDISDTLSGMRTHLPVRTRLVSLLITGGYAAVGARSLLNEQPMPGEAKGP